LNEPSSAPETRARANSILWLLFRVGVSCALVWFLLRGVSLGELLDFFARTVDNWPWLAAALAMPAIGTLASSLRLLCLLRAQRVDASIVELSMLHVISSFYNQLLPSTIGADMIRAYWVSRFQGIGDGTESGTGRILVAGTVIGVERLIGAVGIVATALIASALDPSVLRASPGLRAILPLITIGTLSAIGLLFIIPGRQFGRSVFSIPLLRRVRDKAVTIYGALKAYRRSLKYLFGAFVLSIGLQASIIVQYWLLAGALGLDVSFRGLAVLIPVVTLISMMPITINGIGLREQALRTLGASLGFTAASAVALGWAFVMVKVLWALAGGIIQLRYRPRWMEVPQR